MSSLQRIIPVLVYRDLAAAHDFLVRAFDFESGGVERDDAGNAFHAEVHAAGSTIWLHRVTEEHGMASPQEIGLAGAGIVVHVADVDAHCKRARAAGARIHAEPTDQPYGQREYEARDPEGHRWWFATPVR
jgi:uncharacterized glyoxalase superfamily protein PhnB